MGKKTMIPITSRDFKFTEQSLELTSGMRQSITFDANIIAILIRFTDAQGVVGDTYCCNPNVTFWQTSDIDVSDMTSPFSGYIYNSAKSLQLTLQNNYTLELYNNSTGTVTLKCVAMIEKSFSSDEHTMFLTRNTFLYTDGTITANVSNFLQTITTGEKYKLKKDALVTISNATHVRLSN